MLKLCYLLTRLVQAQYQETMLRPVSILYESFGSLSWSIRDHRFIPKLKECGLDSINMSLDTLVPSKFEFLTIPIKDSFHLLAVERYLMLVVNLSWRD
ncbi:unnamed protein product [Brassica rapa subsp. trilocularis]